MIPNKPEDYEVGTIYASTGSNGSQSNRIRTIDYFELEPNKRYKISFYGEYKIALFEYQEDGTYISGTDWSESGIVINPIVNTTKVRMIVRRIDQADIFPEEVNYLNLNMTMVEGLPGLKWGVIGDSISTIGYKGDGREYPKQIADKNNIILNNLAVPGSMITKTANPSHLTDHMCERVLELDDDCDVVTVAGGVNDYRNGVPLGVMGDTDITTLYGAMDRLCINLITKFPDKPKAIFTPIKYRGKEFLLGKRVDIIKEVAERYAIPVLDNFNSCDLQPDIDLINDNYFYNGDGLHPNGNGHEILSRKIEHFLNDLV